MGWTRHCGPAKHPARDREAPYRGAQRRSHDVYRGRPDSQQRHADAERFAEVTAGGDRPVFKMSSMYGLLNRATSLVESHRYAFILFLTRYLAPRPPQDLRSHASPEKKATTTGDVEQGLTKRG